MGFGGSGNGGGSLGSDNDVALNSPTNNQLLTYNSSVGKWVNASSSPAAGPVSLGDLSDWQVPSGTPYGNVPAVAADGSIQPGGVSVYVLDQGATVPSFIPAGSVVYFRASAAPDLRHTFAQGTAGTDVQVATEGFSSAMSANLAAYTTARPVGISGTTSARFIPGSIRCYVDTGLTNTVEYGRFFFSIESVTGSVNFFEARSSSASICLLQLQSAGQIQIKNIGTTVKTTNTVFSTGTWYRCDFAVGGSGQRWKFYVGNSSTVLEDSGLLGAGTGVPSELRIGYPLSVNANGQLLIAAYDLSDQSLSTPWTA